MPTDDTLLTDAATTALAASKKPRKSDPTQSYRASNARLKKMLRGIKDRGLTHQFKGPVSCDRFLRLTTDFDDADERTKKGSKGKRMSSEALAVLLVRATRVEATCADYVDVYYDHGSEGRANFFPAKESARGIVDLLKARKAGIEWDRAQGADGLIPVEEDTDPEVIGSLIAQLEAAQDIGAGSHSTREAALKERNALGPEIKDAVEKCDKLLRRLNQDHPEHLVHFGMKARKIRGQTRKLKEVQSRSKAKAPSKGKK